MTKMSDIKKMSDKDLISLIREKREAVRGARFNPTARDVRAVRNAKLELARALTEVAQRNKAVVKTENAK